MKLPKNKLVPVVIIVVAVGAILTYFAWVYLGPKQLGQSGRSSESKFLLNEIYYECSRPISGEWRLAKGASDLGKDARYFYPNSQEELAQFCRTKGIIEYRAVIDILRRPDVERTIAKYNTTEAWVRALGHKYIHDKGYLKRILPAYSNFKIDCIIVVHSPEGTRYFIENGEKHASHADHQYIEVPATEFLASLNKAPAADVTAFWLGLH